MAMYPELRFLLLEMEGNLYNHPNGFTSVYCHLQKATDGDDYIQKAHYKGTVIFWNWVVSKTE
jgi:hypothetical protein